MKSSLLNCLVLLSGCCIVGSIEIKRRIDVDDMTKEDLSSFLESLLNKRGEEEDAQSRKKCVGSFEEENGAILRTRDSILAGAGFIEAPEEVETASECKEACCEAVSKKTSRHCDLAVFQQKDSDPEDDQPKCFLFSCIDKNGKDVCITSQNSDYKVLKRKKERVEEQLFSVASNASTQNFGKSETENHHGNCGELFKKQPGIIIRTRDSIKNGAEFLKAPEDVTSAEQCQMQCCTSVSEESSRHCDLAVFQRKDDNLHDKQPKCYLFSCVDQNGQFKCITSPNDGYVVLKRDIDVEEDQLFDVITSSSTKSSTNLPSSTSTTTTTKKTTTPSTTTTTTTTSKTVPVTAQLRSCTRLEWQCDDGACVKVTNVCDGNVDCKDRSDESKCESLKEEDKTLPPVALTQSSTSATSSTTKPTTLSTVTSSVSVPVVVEEGPKVVHDAPKLEDDVKVQKTEPQRGAVLPLALGLSVTACVLLMVGCRLHIMKRKLRRRGKPLAMEESDYLINGMYL